MSLITELNRRRVPQTALAYIVAAWLFVQVADVVLAPFGFTEAGMRALIISLAVAFFPVVIISWFFQFSLTGITRETRSDADDRQSSIRYSAVDFLVWAGLAVAVSYIIFDAFSGRDRPRYAIPLPQPLISSEGSEYIPAISPDGKFVAYSWARPGPDRPFKIFVRAIDRVDPMPLADGDTHQNAPAWSPSGTSIAFKRGRAEGGFDIVIKPFPAGTERVVHTTAQYSSFAGLDWTPEGRYLVFSDQDPDSPKGSGAIFKLDLESGELTQLTFPALNPEISDVVGGSEDADPRVSPDGERLAFRRNVGFKEDICVVTIGGQDLHCVTGDELLTIWDHEWLPNSEEIAVVQAPDPLGGGRRLVAYSVDGDEPYDLLSMPSVSAISIARDGNRVVVAKQEFDRNLMRIRGPAADNAGQPVAITRSTQDERWPDISPDGTELVFFSYRAGDHSLWRSPIDDTRNPRLVLSNILGNWPRWSPNGDSIAFTSSPYRGQTPVSWIVPIDIVDTDGGFPRRLIDEGWGPTWSPDGEWIYYHSAEGPRDEPCNPFAYKIMRRSVSGGEPELLIKCGFRPIEGQDGRLYFMERHDGGKKIVNKIVSVSIGDDDFRTEVESVNFVLWDLSREHLVYVDGRDNRLMVKNLSDGVQREWAAPFENGGIPRVPALRSLSVAADGSWIVYTRAGPNEDEVDLLISELSLGKR